MSETEKIVDVGPQLSGDTVKEPVESGGSPASTPAVETKVQSKFSEDLAQLGSAYGVDVNEFSGESDARAAIKLVAGKYAKIGLNSPATQKNEVAKPKVETEEGFDETALDAKTSAYVKKLRKDAESARRESEEYQRGQEQARQEQTNTAWGQVMERANSVMDSVASHDFGVKNEVNSVQQIKRETVMKTAGAILQGMVASGHAVPAIEKVMETALLLNGYTVSKSQKTSTKASLPPGGVTAAEVKKPASLVIRKPYDPLQVMNDPSFRAGLNEIFGRA